MASWTTEIQGPATVHIAFTGAGPDAALNWTLLFNLTTEYGAAFGFQGWHSDGRLTDFAGFALNSSWPRPVRLGPLPQTPSLQEFGHTWQVMPVNVTPGAVQGVTLSVLSSETTRIQLTYERGVLIGEPRIERDGRRLWYTDQTDGADEVGEYGSFFYAAKWHERFQEDDPRGRFIYAISVFEKPGTARLRMQGGGLDIDEHGGPGPNSRFQYIVACDVAAGGPLTIDFEVDYLVGGSFLFAVPLPLALDDSAAALPPFCRQDDV